MHQSVIDWVAGIVDRYHLQEKGALEVGSRNVNGSCRGLFCGPYVGVDLCAGPGVDVTADAHALPVPPGSVEVVICTEMLEHDKAPWMTIREIARALVWGGHAIITARGIGFPKHNYPADYWRFTADGMRILLEQGGLAAVEVIDDPGASGVFALARKGGE